MDVEKAVRARLASSMNERPLFLGPGVRAEVYTYRNGRTETIYTAAYPTERSDADRCP
jgi:hypothetical protein